LTTNFVNIYMSSLAWKSLFPRTSDSGAIWSIGLIGTALSALPGVWLDQYGNFMVVLGALLVPVGGVLIAHFYLPARDALVSSSTASVSVLYDADGPLGGFVVAGVAAWALGALAFFAAGSIGGTLPSLVVSMGVYVVLTRVRSGKQPWTRSADPAAGSGAEASKQAVDGVPVVLARGIEHEHQQRDPRDEVIVDR
jgi:purine-cytosine permease-like protein